MVPKETGSAAAAVLSREGSGEDQDPWVILKGSLPEGRPEGATMSRRGEKSHFHMGPGQFVVIKGKAETKRHPQGGQGERRPYGRLVTRTRARPNVPRGLAGAPAAGPRDL